MSVEEIERYNVLADEIRKLGLELQTAEKSREIERQAQQEVFSRLAAIERIIEERIDYVNKANGHDFAALRGMGNEIILRLAKLKSRAQPKRKRERKGKR